MGIRIVMADDHKLMREGLRSLILEEENMTIVGEAKDGGSAVWQAEKLAPDVMIMDISMPGLNGIEATRQIRGMGGATKILALSMHSHVRMVVEILSAGASGYLLKDCAFEEVIRAIEVVASGDVYLSENIARAVISDYAQRACREESPPVVERENELLRCMLEHKTVEEIAAALQVGEAEVRRGQQRILEQRIIPALRSAYMDEASCSDVVLTSREKEILTYLKRGKSTAEISVLLNVSGDTVRFHLKNVYQKLHATSRSHAIAIAIAGRLIES